MIELLSNNKSKLATFARSRIVRSCKREKTYFVNRIKDRDRTEIPAQKLAEPARGSYKSLAKKTVSEIDATRCVGTSESSRYPFVTACTTGLFKNMGKFVEGTCTKEWGGAPGTCYANEAENPGGAGGIQAAQERRTKRGPLRYSPPLSPLLLLASLHSLGHSFFSTGGKAEATGSYAPSSWLAFTERLFVADVPDVYAVLRARGEGFPLLEKFGGLSARIPCSGEQVSAERVNLRESENARIQDTRDFNNLSMPRD